jgi:hypothetical protein
MPFDLTIDRAKLFFRGGRPFADIPKPQQQLINRAQVIRHAIAHRSRYSQQRFVREVIAGAPLLPREQNPAGYLRGHASAAPPVTRYETYASSLQVVARKLCG